MGVIVARLQLAPARETMFPSRAPFFKARLGVRQPTASRVTAAEDSTRGNLSVSAFPFDTITPDREAELREAAWA